MPRKTHVASLFHFERDAASMRPRPDAAENAPGHGLIPSNPARFNEAAARCRGKPPTSRTGYAPPTTLQ